MNDAEEKEVVLHLRGVDPLFVDPISCTLHASNSSFQVYHKDARILNFNSLQTLMSLKESEEAVGIDSNGAFYQFATELGSEQVYFKDLTQRISDTEMLAIAYAIALGG